MHQQFKNAMIKQSNQGPIVFICMDLSKNMNVKTMRLRIYEGKSCNK